MGMITLKGFPEDAAYQMLKAVLTHYEDLKRMHPEAAAYNPKTTLQQFCIPFNPGAVRYFKEIGAWTAETEKKQQKVLALGQ